MSSQLVRHLKNTISVDLVNVLIVYGDIDCNWLASGDHGRCSYRRVPYNTACGSVKRSRCESESGHKKCLVCLTPIVSVKDAIARISVTAGWIRGMSRI
ncbi:hypothetical protein TNCV_3789691 [Trichonephila clavipes]|nr:hypothetical protein TNCV_3789691 [Trichonephila clavipes]